MRQRRGIANACFEHSRVTSSVIIAPERADPVRHGPSAYARQSLEYWVAKPGDDSAEELQRTSRSAPDASLRWHGSAPFFSPVRFHRGHDGRAVERHAGKMRGGEVGRFRCRPQGTFLSFRES